MTKQPAYEWYAQLKKPKFAPPQWVFGAVWPLLYIVIALSFMFVIRKVFSGDIPVYIIIPFLLNLVFNLAFSPIQFRLKNNYLALVDVLLVVVTLVWALVAIFPYHPVVAYANIPYLLWGSFASILQIAIVRLNGK